MRKLAKIILTVIAIMSIAGGVFAFKVKRRANFVYTTDPANGICSVKLLGVTTRPNVFLTITSATTIIKAPCVLQSLYTCL